MQARYRNQGPRGRWIDGDLVSVGDTSPWVHLLDECDGWLLAGWLVEVETRETPAATPEGVRRTRYRNAHPDRTLWLGGEPVLPGGTSGLIDALPPTDRWIVEGWVHEVDGETAVAGAPAPSPPPAAVPVDNAHGDVRDIDPDPQDYAVAGVETPEPRGESESGSDVDNDADGLDELNVPQLRSLAAAHDVRPARRNRSTLLAALREAGVTAPES